MNLLRENISKDEADFACILCEFACNDRESFQVHQDEHKAERPFKCSLCEYRARSKQVLQMHTRRHAAQKMYKCRFCPYKSIIKSNTDRHSRIHTGEKPYKCDECGLRMTRKSSLVVHKRIHLKLLPLRCNLCEKSFRKNSNLQAHIRTHTGEKPYKCLMCGFETTESSSLQRHQRAKKYMSACGAKTSLHRIKSSRSRSNKRAGSTPKPCGKKTEKLPAGKTRVILAENNPSSQLNTDRESVLELVHRLEVPVLLPLQDLENSAEGKDAHAIQVANAETNNENMRNIHKPANPKTLEEVVATSEKDQPGPSSSKSKACNTVSNPNAHRDSEEYLDDNLQIVPQTIDAYLNISMINNHKRARPYACAECTFACSREDRLERHYHRNHSVTRAFEIQTEYVYKSDQVCVVNENNVSVSKSMKLSAFHEQSYPSSTENKISVSVVRTVETTEEAFESEPITRALQKISRAKKIAGVKPSLGVNGAEKYICEYCDKKFSSALPWLDHLRHHSGQTLFKCQVPGCIFKTTDKQQLNVHKRNHPLESDAGAIAAKDLP